ncbi:tetratricopeptide repeat protein [Winogradskyella damuponensis]
MKAKILIVFIVIITWSCTNSVNYSESFKKETAGYYLYNPDELIEVYYEGNVLFLNWKEGKIEPVALEENEFFVADMYKKFRFVQHPETKARYLSVIPEGDEAKITYDYLKAPKGYKTPSMHLKDGNYKEALEGYLDIKKEDSTSSYINEWSFNKIGYKHMSNHEYDKAIETLKINAALHPNSINVYDSLAEAYLLKGDSLQAYNNYKKVLDISPTSKRAKRFVEGNASKFQKSL